MYIEHVGLYVKDLDRAKAFYTTYFHAEANGDYCNPATGLRSLFLCFEGDSMLELVSGPTLREPGREDRITGYAHLAFSVGSKEKVNALTRRLLTDGYPVLSGPQTGENGFYESYVADAEGNRIKITV